MKKVLMPLENAHRILTPVIAYIVTTVDKQNRVNAGTFGMVNLVATEPERLMLGVYKEWDTLKNIKQTKEFVVNVPSKNLIQEAWICGDKYAGNPIPYGVDEVKIAGMAEIPSEKVRPPRIAECYAHLECKVKWIKNVGDHFLVLGDIVSASFSEGYFDKNLLLNVSRAQPLMEVGRGLFSYPQNIIEVNRKKAKLKVNKELKKRKIKVPKELKVYEKFSTG